MKTETPPPLVLNRPVETVQNTPPDEKEDLPPTKIVPMEIPHETEVVKHSDVDATPAVAAATAVMGRFASPQDLA